MLGTRWKADRGQLPKGSADEGNPQEEEFISETLTDIQRGGAYKGKFPKYSGTRGNVSPSLILNPRGLTPTGSQGRRIEPGFATSAH